MNYIGLGPDLLCSKLCLLCFWAVHKSSLLCLLEYIYSIPDLTCNDCIILTVLLECMVLLIFVLIIFLLCQHHLCISLPKLHNVRVLMKGWISNYNTLVIMSQLLMLYWAHWWFFKWLLIQPPYQYVCI